LIQYLAIHNRTFAARNRENALLSIERVTGANAHYEYTRNSISPFVGKQEALYIFSFSLSNSRKAFHEGEPPNRVEKSSVKYQNIRIFRSRRNLRFFKYLCKRRTSCPDIEVRVLLVSYGANGCTFHNYGGSKTAPS